MPLDLPTFYESPSATQQTVMSDSRDFTVTDRNPYTSTAPSDLMYADDTVYKFISQVQQFMRSNPFGASYHGALNGILNEELIHCVRQFEIGLKQKFPNAPKIVSGHSISPSAFGEALKLLKTPELKEEPKQEVKEDKLDPLPEIKAFQSFLNQSQPVIGQVYQGPIDGKVNPELISAAQKVEKLIGQAVKNPNSSGLLWNAAKQTFNTSVADLKQALSLIDKFGK